jgi:hypothetical protein
MEEHYRLSAALLGIPFFTPGTQKPAPAARPRRVVLDETLTAPEGTHALLAEALTGTRSTPEGSHAKLAALLTR